MKRPPLDPDREITIQDLYPQFTPEQQAEAEYRLDRFLDLIVRIYERKHRLTHRKRKPRL